MKPATALSIAHETPQRVRFRTSFPPGRFNASFDEACARAGVEASLTYNPRTERYLATAEGEVGLRRILDSAARIAAGKGAIGKRKETPPPPPGRGATNGDSPGSHATKRIARYFLTRALTPPWLQPLVLANAAWPHVKAGALDLAKGRLSSRVLDGTAILSAAAIGDSGTAGTIALMLDLGDTFENWTREKSRDSLTRFYDRKTKKGWVLRGGVPRHVPVDSIRRGETVVVHMGSEIPVDGLVLSGRALVNQQSMTGESLPTPKSKGRTVYAGTAVAEGNLRIRAEKVGDGTRFAQILRVIDQSENLKARVQGEAEALADKIVPYSFLLSAAVGLGTRSFYKAASVLMVDYSCALKLATPLAIKTAMVESVKHGVLIKGGKYIERLAGADVLLVDKTGTLTEAKPSVRSVVAFEDWDRKTILRQAACLEEHFPHPVATAVVQKAAQEGLVHAEENHAKVDYIVAHGISSKVRGERIVVGSKHFVSEDEKIGCAAAAPIERRAARDGLSLLYVGIGGKLAGVILIDDPVRENAARFIRRTRDAGVERIVMLTGDLESSARTVARRLGIDEYRANLLPDDKVRIVREFQERGGVVAMLGDGINDSAAIACADVGISPMHGADIAREAADVLLLKSDLESLDPAIAIARASIARFRDNFRLVLGVNSVLMLGGIVGLIPPALNAVLHNGATFFTSFRSMRPYLRTQAGER